jgi:DNA-binding MarR family transcriptional regulator
MVMQVLVIAVQNAVEYADLGVATSGATLFRLIGGSIGTAVLGAIFAARLDTVLPRLLPASASNAGSGSAITTEMLAALPAEIRSAYASAFAISLSTVFVVAAAVALFGFLLTWRLPEHPLRSTVAATSGERGNMAGGAFARPTSPDSLAEWRRGLAALATREAQRAYIARIVSEAGVALSPAAAWILVRLAEDPTLDPAKLAATHNVDGARVSDAESELQRASLIEPCADSGDGRRCSITPQGADALSRIIGVRRAHIREAAAEWRTGEHEALSVPEIATELVPDARSSG